MSRILISLRKKLYVVIVHNYYIILPTSCAYTVLNNKNLAFNPVNIVARYKNT